MIVLRFAAMVAALVTITLNAHHGFTSAKTLEYAILFAVLYGTLDLAKVSILVAAVHAWRVRAYAIAFLCVLLFPPLFINSVWNALSQVAITREAGQADRVGVAQARARTVAEHARLTSELEVLQASNTFKTTAACTQTKSRAARATCQQVKTTTAALASINQQLVATPPTDPQPHVTLVASMFELDTAPIVFTAALVPVLLAEIVGSLGFTIAAAVSGRVPHKPTERRSMFWNSRRRPQRKTPPDAQPEASQTTPSDQASLRGGQAAPQLTWKLPT